MRAIGIACVASGCNGSDDPNRKAACPRSERQRDNEVSVEELLGVAYAEGGISPGFSSADDFEPSAEADNDQFDGDGSDASTSSADEISSEPEWYTPNDPRPNINDPGPYI